MAMTVGQDVSEDEQEVMAAINTTPLVDVMLVLLIIFLITIPVETQEVPVNLPKDSNAATQTNPENIAIAVNKDGTVFWNGDTIANRQELEARFTQAAGQPIQPEFHLRPNKLVTYKHVAGVMASAQRLGITKIGLIGAEQFMD